MSDLAQRYRIGFENKGIKCDWVTRNPGFVSIVDTGSVFAFGAVVALVDGQDTAERITNLLNAAEPK